MAFFSKKLPLSDTSELLAEESSSFLSEILQLSIIAVLIVIPIRFFIAQPFIVSGASMEDTFHSGEYLIVDQLTYHFEAPTRGDVIVFRYPRDPSKYFIKRIIGVPGDTVTIEDGIITVTNKDYPEGVILSEPYAEMMPPAAKLVETIGEREFFVMGDNRDQSSDSRAWGVLQEERIVGRAWLRLFPPQEAEYLPGAATPEIITKRS